MVKYNIGDKVVLKESSMDTLIRIFGYSENIVKRVMEVTKMTQYGYVVQIKTNIVITMPFEAPTNYRLATDGEIRRDKIKYIFSNK
jgi:hypothetical protein